MIQHIRIVLLTAVIIFMGTTAGFAVTVNTIGFGDSDWWPGDSPGILGERSQWAEVAEVEDYATDARTTVSGNFTVFDVGPELWDKGIWVFGAPGYVEVAFTQPSESLFVQFESDSNDGPADFYIDGTLVHSLNTNNGSWFAVVFSGLSMTTHTLRVVATAGTAFVAAVPNHLGIDAMGSGAPEDTADCYPDLPDPVLAFDGTEQYTVNGQQGTRYLLSVTNYADYPDELFAPAPSLPPCGSNTNASRTWVDIFDQDGNRLYGFCALGTSANLNNLWFGVPEGDTPPTSVYITMTDRECDIVYTSNSVSLGDGTTHPVGACILDTSGTSAAFGFDGATNTLYIYNVRFFGQSFTINWLFDMTNGNWNLHGTGGTASGAGGLLGFSPASVEFSECLNMIIRGFRFLGESFTACWRLNMNDGRWEFIDMGDQCGGGDTNGQTEDQYSTVTVHVTNVATNNDLAGALLNLTGPEDWIGTTGPGGIMVWQIVSYGSYVLEVTGPAGYVGTTLNVTVDDPMEYIELGLDPISSSYSTVSVHVIDAVTNDDIIYPRVDLSGPGHSGGIASELGTIVFQNVPYGTYTLEVTGALGYEDATLNVAVNEAIEQIEVYLNPITSTSTVTVHVTDSFTSEDLAGAFVSLFGPGQFSDTTGIGGTVVFQNVPYGTYDIEVIGPVGYGALLQSGAVVDGPSEWFEVGMDPAV